LVGSVPLVLVKFADISAIAEHLPHYLPVPPLGPPFGGHVLLRQPPGNARDTADVRGRIDHPVIDLVHNFSLPGVDNQLLLLTVKIIAVDLKVPENPPLPCLFPAAPAHSLCNLGFLELRNRSSEGVKQVAFRRLAVLAVHKVQSDSPALPLFSEQELMQEFSGQPIRIETVYGVDLPPLDFSPELLQGGPLQSLPRHSLIGKDKGLPVADPLLAVPNLGRNAEAVLGLLLGADPGINGDQLAHPLFYLDYVGRGSIMI